MSKLIKLANYISVKYSFEEEGGSTPEFHPRERYPLGFDYTERALNAAKKAASYTKTLKPQIEALLDKVEDIIDGKIKFRSDEDADNFYAHVRYIEDLKRGIDSFSPELPASEAIFTLAYMIIFPEEMENEHYANEVESYANRAKELALQNEREVPEDDEWDW